MKNKKSPINKEDLSLKIKEILIKKSEGYYYNEEILEQTLLLFRKCLNRKEAKQCKNIIHYIIHIIPTISGWERTIEIKDSS